MTRRHCDTGRIDCPHLPECKWECHYDNATMETRKIKPYPAVVPDDIEPVSETWHTVGKWMIGAVLAMLVVFFVLMFFSGVFLWSLIV